MSDEVVQWFQNKTEDLWSCNENSKQALIELKSGVTALDAQSLLGIVRSVQVNTLFNCLNFEDTESAEIASDVIFALLNILPFEECITSYGSQIQNGVAHSSPHIKRSFLKLLQNNTSVEALILLSTHQPDVLTQVIECLRCPDRSIAEGAVIFFKKLGKNVNGIQILFAEAFVEILNKLMAVDDITRFRIYEIVVDAAVSTPEGLVAAHSSGILPSLLTELKSTDTLIQLNALELLTSITANNDGLLYLQREGVIKYLVEKILNLDEEPMSFILLPGLIEFFGNLYKLQPIVFSQQHPEVLTLLFKSFQTIDPALLGVVISTVGKIGFTDEGKRVLWAHRDKVNTFLGKILPIIQKKNDLSVTAMNSLSVLLCCEDSAVVEYTRTWFDALGPQALETIVNTAKLPFVELRLSALELLKALTSQEWGVLKISKYPALLEFLLDRTAEFDKHCKLTKYEAIKGLVSHPKSAESIPSNQLIKLKQFVGEGPYYVETEPEMLFEGAS